MATANVGAIEAVFSVRAGRSTQTVADWKAGSDK